MLRVSALRLVFVFLLASTSVQADEALTYIKAGQLIDVVADVSRRSISRFSASTWRTRTAVLSRLPPAKKVLPKSSSANCCLSRSLAAVTQCLMVPIAIDATTTIASSKAGDDIKL
jgi:hypothetical protein